MSYLIDELTFFLFFSFLLETQIYLHNLKRWLEKKSQMSMDTQIQKLPQNVNDDTL